jgi:hypothetical protein
MKEEKRGGRKRRGRERRGVGNLLCHTSSIGGTESCHTRCHDCLKKYTNCSGVTIDVAPTWQDEFHRGIHSRQGI